MKSRQKADGSAEYTDNLIRKLAIGSGIVTGLCFLFSLVALIEFPGLFKYLAFGMITMSVVFLLLRSVYNYRMTFRVKK